jgi:hypothetical protein
MQIDTDVVRENGLADPNNWELYFVHDTDENEGLIMRSFWRPKRDAFVSANGINTVDNKYIKRFGKV